MCGVYECDKNKNETQLIKYNWKERPGGYVRPLKQEIKMLKMYIYFKNGNVYSYKVESAEKAREHALTLARMNVSITARIQ